MLQQTRGVNSLRLALLVMIMYHKTIYDTMFQFAMYIFRFGNCLERKAICNDAINFNPHSAQLLQLRSRLPSRI
jgi:hypothetical protein